jgi:hypothetical protein
MNTCSPDRIITALHEQTELITDIVREEIKDSPNLALRMIPDGGTVARNANNSSVIYGEAKQASVAYNTVDHSARPLEAAGYTHADDFKGRTQNGNNGIFNNLANEYDNSRGQFTIDFAQGYRIRGFDDFELAVDTPIKDARELDRLGKEHIRGYFNGVKNQFTRWGMNNFSDNLLNLVIQHGEANASVIAADQFNVTTNGWQAPPAKRITIHFLQDYRDHIIAEMIGKGFSVSEDWVLEVEMPREDWIDAVRADQINRNLTNGTTQGLTNYNTEWFKDEEGPLRNRQFGVYGGIKCYFNERPIRGYFKKVSTVGDKDNFAFVRVYDWINTMGENGGIVCSTNHDYRKEFIVVDGVKHNMVTLIPHIDPRSFKRYGLMKPLKTIGGDNSGVNYEVKVIDGAFLGCNDFNDKFKLTARHEFRFKALYPEFSGFIAYRHSQRLGYALDVSGRTYASGPDTPAEHEQFQTTGVDDCMAAQCAQCDQVSETTGECVDSESADASVVGLSPAGAVTTVSRSANYDLKLLVSRTGGAAACSVDYTTADGTASAGADYTLTAGTLEWEAGDTAPKEVTIPVLAAATDAQTFTLTISNPVGATLLTGANVTTVTIDVI